MFKNRKVLIAGGSGFVGTNLAVKLKIMGAEVYATYRNSEPKIRDMGIKYIYADLSVKEDCERIMKGIDYLFMTAGYVPGAQGVENEQMAFVTEPTIVNLRVLEAACKCHVKKVCFISSTNGYPLSEKPLVETQAMVGDPFEKYYFVGWHKRFTEIVCRMYADKMKKMQIIAVKVDNIYGPYDNFKKRSSHVIASLIRKVVERQDPIEVWGTGDEYKDFIYIEDLVDGILLAMEKIENSFEIINIASGRNITINNVLDIIIKADHYEHAQVWHNLEKPTTIPYRVISVEKAEDKLGFKTKYSIEEGIKKTVEWYRQNPCRE